MRHWRKLLAAMLMVAVASHLLCLFGLPYLASLVVWQRIADYGPVNTFVHAPQVSPELREIMLPSPDLLYSVCVFDLSKGPLHVHSDIPESYWCLAMYAHNTDNFFVLRNQEARGRHGDLLLLGPRGEPPAGFDGRVVRSPSSRGLIMVRTLIRREEQLPALLAVQRSATADLRPLGPGERND